MSKTSFVQRSIIQMQSRSGNKCHLQCPQQANAIAKPNLRRYLSVSGLPRRRAALAALGAAAPCAVCRRAVCHRAVCRRAVCRRVVCRRAGCRRAGCRHAGCRRAALALLCAAAPTLIAGPPPTPAVLQETLSGLLHGVHLRFESTLQHFLKRSITLLF